MTAALGVGRSSRTARERRGEATVVAVFGPTGIGKTDVVLALGDIYRDRGEWPVAISADALQVYEGLATLTGAPTAAEQARLEHRFVASVPLDREFSVGAYMPLAHAAIDAACTDGRRPIVVGGTGLYLRAALADLSLAPSPPRELRMRLEADLSELGPAAMHERVAARDRALASTIEPTDRTRIVRALERLELGGRRGPDESELWTADVRRPTRLFALVMDRAALYRRIDARVERMLAAGAADEVRRAVARGASRTARKALGFDELLAGDTEAMKRRTRNYAKRQLTWLRKLSGVTLVDMTGRGAEDAAAEIARAT